MPAPVQLASDSGVPVGTSTNPLIVAGAAGGATSAMPVIGAGGRTTAATFTPAAAAYSAGDTMDVAKAFLLAGPAGGGSVMIVGTVLEVDASALQSGETSYTLQVYTVTPPSAFADNTAWDLPSGDRTSHLATILLGTPIDLGATLKIEQDNLNKLLVVPSGGSLFAYLVTASAFTATAAARIVTLKTVSM